MEQVHLAAFPTSAEARLVRELLAAGKGVISLVAEQEGKIVGHLLLSPVTLDGGTTTMSGLGLAPLAVLPSFQRQGIGCHLVREAVIASRSAGWRWMVVLGHHDYYPRFGFRRASDWGIENEYGAGDSFQVLELQPGGLAGVRGLVRYAPEFAAFG